MVFLPFVAMVVYGTTIVLRTYAIYILFIKTTKKVHEFYDEYRKSLKDKFPYFDTNITQEPHKVSIYELIFQLSQKYNVINFTTNIDDLYEKADIPVTHLHGIVTKIKCMECEETLDIKYKSLNDIDWHGHKCHHDTIKPDITFFGEGNTYPEMKNVIRTLTEQDFFIVIGASLKVVPIDYWLRYSTCTKININPDVKAGYGKDCKNWINIKDTASSGLMKIILQYFA